MKQKIISLHRAIGISMLLIIGTAGIFCKTSALANGIGTAYIALTIPSYKHPITDEIEDSGKNEGIGQGMTESVLNPKALIEKEKSGKIYATVRFYLTDNISKVSFQTQKKGTSKWTKSPSKVMQENIRNKYCTDYRFQIPDQTAIVRTEFYVTAMGRNVIFYFTFSDLKEGSGDFIVTVSSEGGENKNNKGAEKTTSSNTTATEVKNKKIQKNGITGQIQKNKSDIVENQVEEKETSLNKSVENNSTSQKVEDAEEKIVQLESMTATGAELIEQADGLVYSDSTENGLAESDKEVKETDDNKKENINSGSVAALPWTLVWQCILIITIPPCLIGASIIGGICFIKRMEDLK